MATIPVTELITRAALAADMHDNFATPAWLYWANVEDKALRVRLARCSYPIDIQTVSLPITPSTPNTLNEPMAICAIHYLNDDGSLFRLSHRGYLDREYNTPPEGIPTEFSVIKTPTQADTWELKFNRTFTGTIIMDWIPHPTALTINSSVNYPLGFEERIVLGMARRALAKEETVNPMIEAQIREIDEHIDNACWSRLMGDTSTVRAVHDNPINSEWVLF